MEKIKVVIIFIFIFAVLGGIIFIRESQKSRKNYTESEKLLSVTPSSGASGSDISPSPTQSASGITETDKPEEIAIVFVMLDVPFTAQSPFGEWDDPLQQDGCEEAASLIAMRWAKGEEIVSKQEAKDAMLAISNWQIQNYGGAVDTSAQDTADRIIKGYYDWQKVRVEVIESPQDIIREIVAGNLAILPMDGQKLGNPFFTTPGPERHMLVVIGYDPEKLEFITNDPGTRQGKHYRYPVNVLWSAIRDYPTGDHEPITKVEKNMIVISR